MAILSSKLAKTRFWRNFKTDQASKNQSIWAQKVSNEAFTWNCNINEEFIRNYCFAVNRRKWTVTSLLCSTLDSLMCSELYMFLRVDTSAPQLTNWSWIMFISNYGKNINFSRKQRLHTKLATSFVTDSFAPFSLIRNSIFLKDIYTYFQLRRCWKISR